MFPIPSPNPMTHGANNLAFLNLRLHLSKTKLMGHLTNIPELVPKMVHVHQIPVILFSTVDARDRFSFSY
ncbi:hypothetical protein LCGC14_2011980 [marine sediment metagenome]|uniref:Uncharacterized protein n=1 Tax=marine sediment metagenome TaxID=412755 RepID=A0A0F9FMH2_9ZZZZ